VWNPRRGWSRHASETGEMKGSKGVLLMRNLLTLIVAPIIVGIAIKLFERWLDDQDNV